MSQFPEFEQIRLLPGGHTLQVALVRLASGRLAVCKTITGSWLESGWITVNGERLPSEIAAHRILKEHRRIVQFLGHKTIPPEQIGNQNQYRILLEYCNGRDLHQLLEYGVQNGHYFPEAFLWHVFKQAIEALDYLTVSGIEHLDGHAGNMFLRFDGPILAQFPDLVMADFGQVDLILPGELEPHYQDCIQLLAGELYSAIIAYRLNPMEDSPVYSQELLDILGVLLNTHRGTNRPFTLRYIIDNIYPDMAQYIQRSGPPVLPEWMRQYFLNMQENTFVTGGNEGSSSRGSQDPEIGDMDNRPGEREPLGARNYLPELIDGDNWFDLGLVVHNLTQFFYHNPPRRAGPGVALYHAITQDPVMDLDDPQAVINRLYLFIDGGLLPLLHGTYSRFTTLQDDIEFDSFCVFFDYAYMCRWHIDQAAPKLYEIEDRPHGALVEENNLLMDLFNRRLAEYEAEAAQARDTYEQDRTDENLQDLLRRVDASIQAHRGQVEVNQELRRFERIRLDCNESSLRDQNRYMKRELGIPENQSTERFVVMEIVSERELRGRPDAVRFRMPSWYIPEPAAPVPAAQEVSPGTHAALDPPAAPQIPTVVSHLRTQDDEDRDIQALRQQWFTQGSPDLTAAELASIEDNIAGYKRRIQGEAIQLLTPQSNQPPTDPEAVAQRLANSGFYTEEQARIWVSNHLHLTRGSPLPESPTGLRVTNPDQSPPGSSTESSSSSSRPTITPMPGPSGQGARPTGQRFSIGSDEFE